MEIDRTTVEMKDGVKLAVTFYKPADASAEKKYPIVLNMVPYRKDDLFYAGDYGMYTYLAARGIACARIDIRGTGGSDGAQVDREYSDAELNDLETCISKFAALPWCNGNIGMQGKSWAGFNALMMAMRQPPALKAVIAAHASEDLYANDVHNWDGILHLDIFTEEIETEGLMPKSPNYVLDADYFKNRFDRDPWFFTYLEHQRDGKFWRDGRSLFTGYNRVKIPIYVINQRAGRLPGLCHWDPRSRQNTGQRRVRPLEPRMAKRWRARSPLQQLADCRALVEAMALRRRQRRHERTEIHRLRARHRPGQRRLRDRSRKIRELLLPIKGVADETLQLSASGELVSDAAQAGEMTIPVDPRCRD